MAVAGGGGSGGRCGVVHAPATGGLQFGCGGGHAGDRLLGGVAIPLSRLEAIDGCPNFFADHVLIGSQDATLYCLNADSGKLVWKHAIDDQIRCTPTVVENRAFVAGSPKLLREGGRFVLHLLYAVPIQRGATHVIEDIVLNF